MKLPTAEEINAELKRVDDWSRNRLARLRALLRLVLSGDKPDAPDDAPKTDDTEPPTDAEVAETT